MINSKISASKTCLSISLLLCAFLTSACSNESAQLSKPSTGKSVNTTSIQAQKLEKIEPVKDLSRKESENELITLARKITKDYKLTAIRLECLKFELQQDLFENKHMISARELHSDSCGGDINTSPRLFSIGIDETSGEVWSDAKSLLGQLEKLD